MSRTVLLAQPTERPEGRTHADYESVNECVEGVCKASEERLKRMDPNSPCITHDISQLLALTDDLAGLSCLVHRADPQTYQPYNKDWIKEKICGLLRGQAQQAGK